MSASSVMSSGSVRKVENGANDDQEVEGVDIFGGDNDQTRTAGLRTERTRRRVTLPTTRSSSSHRS